MDLFKGYCKLDCIEDMEVFSVIESELIRQQEQIELIASENFVSKAVLSAVGSVMINKYAEGYPYRRYYGGCKYVDAVEQLAIKRVCKLFNSNFANVQPHSGTQANMAAFFALGNPGDTVLGMGLDMGGHLTHGSHFTVSGKWFASITYGVKKDGVIDYEQVEELAHIHKPKIIIAGASAYARKIDFLKFRNIADSVGAFLIADIAHYAGLIAAGEYPSPIDHAHVVTFTTHKTLRGPRGAVILTNDEVIAKKIDSAVFPGIQGGPQMHSIAAKAVAFGEALNPSFKLYIQQVLKNCKSMANKLIEHGLSIVSGGTDCHLIIVDLRTLFINGKTAESILEESGITCNKNTIPFDPLPPFQTSGIRLGSAAMTSRGLNEDDFVKIADLIYSVLSQPSNTLNIKKIRKLSLEICKQYPLYS